MIPAEPAERHRAIAATFAQVVAGVADWAAPTPVAEWTAIDVLDHLVEWPVGFLAGGGIVIAPATGDPATRWRRHTAAIQALLDGPGRDDLFTHPMAGSFPLATAIDMFYTTDVFMHAWDLAAAGGQPDPLDADEAERVLQGMLPIDAMLRQSGHYGPRVAVPDDAAPQDRLMAFIGRDPAWRPAG
ncbi:MAG: maleylpyruvate isomerase family mycothiol-dependent enzyme [Actinomycetota bacterium]|nr:maleylpyruvate isomerase family mycothiol-dependent enzyme [Actinomycetota bacterium]